LVKFLIIRFSSIGDIVLTTPVIRCLKNQVEGAQVHFLVKKQFSPVIVQNPYIDKLHIFEGDLTATLQELRAEHFDYIIDLHRSIRSSIVCSRLRFFTFRVDKINFRKWLIVKLKINRLPDKHIVDRYFETVKTFDMKNDGKGLDYFIPDDDEVDRSVLPASFHKAYIGLVIGGMHYTKQMPLEQLTRLIGLLTMPVILLGSGDDRKLGNEITDACPGAIIYNACGEYNINQSASLVRQASLIITPDTGLMHIAAAFRKKIISVWGNTIPEFGMYPYFPDPGSKIFEVKGLSCRPCSRIGYEKCPKKHFRCMMDQNIEEMARLANSITG
jgi:ADP-heptose:LPS heptosyltransferase